MAIAGRKFFFKLLIKILGFLEFLGTILQDLENSWISWIQDSYQEFKEFLHRKEEREN